MASFFDQKEEVLSVELTNHGRKLFAQGIFNVDKYLFFDNSIIYETNENENQNSIETRILNNSITLKALNLLEKQIDIVPLGTSDYFSEYAPAWNINFLKGTFAYTPTGSSYHKKKFDLTSTVTVAEIQTTNLAQTRNFNNSSLELEDGRIINIDNDYILLELKEINVTDDFKNFEIEVFTYDELNGGEEAGLRRQLQFLERQSNIIDGIIYEDNELPQRYGDIQLDETNVEFYLDFLVDDEIDEQLIRGAEQILRDEVKATYAPTVTEKIADKVKDNC